MRRGTAAAALFLALAAGGAAAGDQAATEAIRDIAGPLPPSGLPPFAATAAVLVVAASGTLALRRRKVNPEGAETTPATTSPEAEIEALRQAYLNGDLCEAILFDRLYGVIGSALPMPDGSDAGALTSDELIKAAGGILPPSLLRLCDEVRFGAGTPGREAVLSALDAASAAAASFRR